jgi:lathosterol oxidase
VLEEKVNRAFGDEEPKGFGTGWWSGVLSAFFGFLSFGAVLCLHFPQLLTAPEMRPHYPMPVMRMLIQGVIVAAIFFGGVASLLRRKKVLPLSGMLLAFAAILLGGASVPINQTLHDGPAIGLDWFLLDLLLMALIYVPIERLWPQYPEQGTFRAEWTLDVAYFLSTHLPVQILSLAILWPATEANRLFGNAALQRFVGGLPWLVQFALAVLIADLAEYAAHRLVHRVPFLWRFHAVHHSSKSLDWIAGSRAHFVDDLIIRGAVLLPIVVLGFSQSILAAYLVFVTLHATWTHCNFGPTSAWLEKFLVLPRHHHWHHAIEKDAIDKNYAIHFPWIDKIFGTFYAPPDGRWPDRYGLDGHELSPTFVGQTIDPFLGK